MKDDLIYLQHIADAIIDIENYTAGGERVFFETKMIQDAVIRNLEIIGEAVKNISPVTREESPETPWKQIAGLRDVLIHHYFGIDEDEVWDVIENDIIAFKKIVISSIQQIAPELKNDLLMSFLDEHKYLDFVVQELKGLE